VVPSHEVTTAFDLDWHRLKDHERVPLLQDRFDVLVTIDQGFEFEHNLEMLTFGIIIVHVAKNKGGVLPDAPWPNADCAGTIAPRTGVARLNDSPQLALPKPACI
jgi:hypothetical protein